MSERHDDESPSPEELAAWEERLADTEGRLKWLSRRISEVLSGLARLRADGRGESAEAEKLREERRTLGSEAEELEATVPLLEEQIEEGRAALLHAQARARVKEAASQANGQVGEQANRRGRFEEAVELVVGRLEALEGAVKTQEGLIAEIRALCRRFDLEEPKLSHLPGLSRDETVVEAFRRLQGLGLYKGGFHRDRVPEDSPGAKLLEEAGPTDEEKAEQERREAKRRARREREAQALQGVQGELEALENLPPGVKVG